MNKQHFGSLMLLFASIIWGFQYTVQTLASGLGTFTVVFFKSAGCILLLALALIKKEKFNKKTIICGAITGLVSFTGITLQQKGIELSSAANASFITALYIVIVPILGLLFKKKPKKKIWLAILIALVGMYLLCIKGEFKLRIGDLVLLGGSLMFSIQILLIDKFIKDCDPIAYTAVQQILSAIISGIIAFTIEKPTLANIVECLPLCLYLAIFAGATGQAIQNRFQKDVEPSVASLIMSFESVFGALFAWIFLNQALTIKEIIGCILIFIAVLIAE